jgi:hypothetical protein
MKFFNFKLMSNLNGIYHKGRFRGGEWAKHLRPYLKRVGNKRWRKTGTDFEDELLPVAFRGRRPKGKPIVVKMTFQVNDEKKYSRYGKYRNMRDARNATGQAHVINYVFLKGSVH